MICVILSFLCPSLKKGVQIFERFPSRECKRAIKHTFLLETSLEPSFSCTGGKNCIKISSPNGTVLLGCSAQPYLFFVIYSWSGSSGNKPFFLIRHCSVGISLIYSTIHFGRWRDGENWGMRRHFPTPRYWHPEIKVLLFLTTNPWPLRFLVTQHPLDGP